MKKKLSMSKSKFKLLYGVLGMFLSFRGYFRLKLSPTSRRRPQWLNFFKNLFYQNNCKEAINIGEGGQIMGALFKFFCTEKAEKVPFFVSCGWCPQFLKWPLSFEFEFVYVRTGNLFSFYNPVTVMAKLAKVFAFSPKVMDTSTFS